MKVNGIEIKQKEFAFDGCHKFYLLNNSAEKKEAEGYGYEIYPIDELPKKFWNSCPLRFIETWDLSERLVPQCESVVKFVDNSEKTIVLDFEKDEVEEV